MANANLRATYNINAVFQYAGSTGLNFPGALGPRAVAFVVTGTGANVALKSYQIQATIPAGDVYTLDLESFTDNLMSAASWTSIMFAIIEHNSASLATDGVDLSGAEANAIPSFRGSMLLPGQGCVPFYSRTTASAGTAGMALSGPDTRLVIRNLDAANDATVDILLQGN